MGALPIALNRTTTVGRAMRKSVCQRVIGLYLEESIAYSPLDESFFLYCSSACTAAIEGLPPDAIEAADPSCRSTSVTSQCETKRLSMISLYMYHCGTSNAYAPWLGVKRPVAIVSDAVQLCRLRGSSR